MCFPFALLIGTFFSGEDGVQFKISCSPGILAIQDAYYGSSSCGPNNVKALVAAMVGYMQTLYVNPSPQAFNSSCPDGGNIFYGWYKCNPQSKIRHR